ncbi:MAG: hypothetical protein LBL90_02880 [Prevotellaceae bacterium]|jgi:outer membrane lipoprotein-sorting protein|nr:hypothetical protein [Prevotellaceae bacterium]
MKKIMLTLICITVVVGAWAQNVQKTAVEENNLKGKVKSVRRATYDAVFKFGKMTKGDYF